MMFPAWPTRRSSVFLPAATNILEAAEVIRTGELAITAAVVWLSINEFHAASDLPAIRERDVLASALPEDAKALILHARRVTWWNLTHRLRRFQAEAF